MRMLSLLYCKSINKFSLTPYLQAICVCDDTNIVHDLCSGQASYLEFTLRHIIQLWLCFKEGLTKPMTGVTKAPGAAKLLGLLHLKGRGMKTSITVIIMSTSRVRVRVRVTKW